MKTRIAPLLLATALFTAPALAQAPATAPAKPSLLARMKAKVAKPAAHATKPVAAPAAASAKGQQPRTAKSLACSKDADAKNIHGAARKAFMSKCKKA